MNELYIPELIFFSGASLLEGPCWNEENKSLLCVSIEQECIYIVEPESGIIKTYPTNGQVGCAVYEDAKHVLSAEYHGIYRIDLMSGEREYVTQFNQNLDLRYNDGKMDPVGRFLVGTTGYHCFMEGKSSLYSWDGKKAKELIKHVSISNGIAFSKNGDYMYYVDSPTRRINGYHYDVETGNLVYDKVIAEITDEGMPDGICMDADGNLWVAQWGGFAVNKWSVRDGKRLMKIEMPCKNVTSCCLGGENGEFLFVTTAKHDDGTKSEPLAGGLFRVLLGTTG